MTQKTDTEVLNLVINTLTKAQYDDAKAQGQISDTELYMVTDDTVYATVDELATKQNQLTAGQGIGISEGVISADVYTVSYDSTSQTVVFGKTPATNK